MSIVGFSLAKSDWVIDFDPSVNDCLLHAPSEAVAAYLDDDDRDPWDAAGQTLCGQQGKAWGIAGIVSRISKKRCPQCCELTGIPPGVGSPKNDNECRRVIGLSYKTEN